MFCYFGWVTKQRYHVLRHRERRGVSLTCRLDVTVVAPGWAIVRVSVTMVTGREL